MILHVSPQNGSNACRVGGRQRIWFHLWPKTSQNIFYCLNYSSKDVKETKYLWCFIPVMNGYRTQTKPTFIGRQRRKNVFHRCILIVYFVMVISSYVLAVAHQITLPSHGEVTDTCWVYLLLLMWSNSSKWYCPVNWQINKLYFFKKMQRISPGIQRWKTINSIKDQTTGNSKKNKILHCFFVTAGPAFKACWYWKIVVSKCITTT